MNDICWQPGMRLDQVEKQVILKAYRFYDNNKAKTAQALGISYRTIRYKLADWGICKNDESEIAGEDIEQGNGVEPSKGIPKESALPMREREEIQEMSPVITPGRRARRHSQGA